MTSLGSPANGLPCFDAKREPVLRGRKTDHHLYLIALERRG